MKTLIEIISLSADYLHQRNIQHPRRQAEEVISDALDLSRIQLYAQFDRPLTEEELAVCRERITRRARGEPAQYIRGKVEFLDCTIEINQHVLIPRQETEILADLIYKALKAEDLTGKVLWDICCGSGCIGIALKKKYPTLHVVLSDISQEALFIAKKNAELNGVDVELKQGNLLEPFKGQRADFLVSNPPYVSDSEWQSLDREVKDFEPKLALVAQNEGLNFYQQFAEQLLPYLNPKARVWFEIGATQGPSLKALFDQPHWKKASVEQDWAGHDRFFFLEIE